MIITVISECIDHVRVDITLLCILQERGLFLLFTGNESNVNFLFLMEVPK